MMNERFWDLVEQVNEQGGDDPDIRDMVFAKLIIQEFEKVAKQQPWYYDAPSCGWKSPIDHVCNEIKQHFGVE